MRSRADPADLADLADMSCAEGPPVDESQPHDAIIVNNSVGWGGLNNLVA